MAQYLTTIEAESYFDGKLHIPYWVEADEDQERAQLAERLVVEAPGDLRPPVEEAADEGDDDARYPR